MYMVWNHRNKIISRDGKVDTVEIFTVAQLKIWGRINNKYPRLEFSYSDWCLKLMIYLHQFRQIQFKLATFNLEIVIGFSSYRG